MQDWVILWEVRNSRSHFNDDNNNGEGNCIPAAQACRELVEFSEELTIQWTWNASLALAGASLWSSANCRWPVFDVTPNTVTDGDKTPVIRRHIIVFSWTVTSSAFIKTVFCSLLKFFSECVSGPHAWVFWASGTLRRSARIGGIIWQNPEQRGWRTAALLHRWSVLSTNRSQPMSKRK